jgi:SNF2 family DNA or RNA helicase
MNEFKRIMSNTRKRKTSNLSMTTSDSDSTSTNNDHHDIEIDKTYSTRNRTIQNNKIINRSSSITIDSSTPDIENTENSIQEITNNDNEREENFDKPWLDKMRQQFWFPFLDMLHEQSQFDIELGGKILLLKFIIDKCAEIDDKILLFSRSLYSLDYIEKFLKHLHIENEKQYQILLSNNTNNGHIPPPVQWILDQDYFRIDGRTKIILRKQYIERFNDLLNIHSRLFLISTQAGGIGINLTASNRIIVFDASWNPR